MSEDMPTARRPDEVPPVPERVAVTASGVEVSPCRDVTLWTDFATTVSGLFPGAAFEIHPAQQVVVTLSGEELEPAREAELRELMGIAARAAAESPSLTMTDVANIFGAAHASRDLIVAMESKTFALFSGGCWHPGRHAEVHAARRIHRSTELLETALAEFVPEPTTIIVNGREKLIDRHHEFRTLAKSMSTSVQMRHTILADVAERHLPISIEETIEPAEAARPTVINTPAGVLDLETLKVQRRARPDDLFMSRTTVSYDPSMRSDLWESLHEGIFAGYTQEEHDYLQQLLGAGLLRVPGLKLFGHLWGVGGSAKSTLMGLYSASLGHYAAVLPESALYARQGSQAHTSDRMALTRGARVAVVQDMSNGKPIDIGFVKSLIGGDTQALAEKGKPFAEYKVAVSILAVTNHPFLNTSRDPDPAFFRGRLKPFEFRNPLLNPDTTALGRAKVDLAAQTACLTFAAQGAKTLIHNGLQIQMPEAFARHAEEMAQANDPRLEWLEKSLVREDGAMLDYAKVRSAWLAHANSAGIEPGREQDMAESLRAYGLRQRKHPNRHWVGATIGESVM